MPKYTKVNIPGFSEYHKRQMKGKIYGKNSKNLHAAKIEQAIIFLQKNHYIVIDSAVNL